MTLREATPADMAAVRALHDGENYPLPPNDGRLLSVQVAEHEGRVVAAVLAVRAAEIVMVMDRQTISPWFRWLAIKALHRQMEQRLSEMHVDSAYCWLAPQYAKAFGRRLTRLLGWTEPAWRCLQRKVAE